MSEFLMPSLGAEMEVGTLVEWLVKPGDHVKRGDIVAVVETEKGAIEIEIFENGVVARLLVELGATIPVGTPLALIEDGTPTDRVPGTLERQGVIAPPSEAHFPKPPAPLPSVEQICETRRHRASPAARWLAQSLGVDLAQITGTGPQGTIVRADVERGKSLAKQARGFNVEAMRMAIGAAMARSKREIPHYYLEHHVDVSAAEEWLAATNAPRPPESRLLLAALAIKAVALAAGKYPVFNGHYREGHFIPAPAVHIGIAISMRGGGLMAPALHNASELSLEDLMKGMHDLVARVRAGRVRSSEISDPTITVSSLGERGVESLHGIIYPPQVAIIGVGKIVIRPWVVDNRIVARPLATLTLAADHRVSDGHLGALFLAEIGKMLEEPQKL